MAGEGSRLMIKGNPKEMANNKNTIYGILFKQRAIE